MIKSIKKYSNYFFCYYFISILLYRFYFYIKIDQLNKLYIACLEVLFVMFITLSISQLFFIIINYMIDKKSNENNKEKY